MAVFTQPSGENWREVRIVHRALSGTEIVVLNLEAADGGALPAFTAGSHIDVEVTPQIVRQYSLANSERDTARYQIGVLKETASRGGSHGIHSGFREGDVVRIREPRNNFPLAPESNRSVLLAGGIGITPLLSMAEYLVAAGDDVTLHYCVRSRDRAAFLDRLESDPLAPHVRLHLDDQADAQKLNLDESLGPYQAGSHLYVCGPSGFIDFVLGGARSRGWPEGALHREYFSAGNIAPSGEETEFTIQLARSGLTLTVPPEKTVASVIMEAGIDLPVSCEQGVCGTCLTRVLEGEPDHRDLFMTDQEHALNDQFTPCCSRSISRRLVLDL